MSTDDHLNYDLFGNVVPNPMPAPPEEHVSPYSPEEMWTDNIQANVPKFTPVKEGQQHPEGKHGQYKLFHEHVWPKGYTPERLNEVDANMPLVSTFGRSYAPGEARRAAVDHLARSTVPVEDLQNMRKNNFQIRFGAILENASGGFVAVGQDRSKGIGPGVMLPTKQKVKDEITDETLRKKGRGFLKTRTGHSLIHEVGHAADFEQDPARFINEPKTPYETSGGIEQVKPRAEGRAEGYRTAHHRATRAMRRARKNSPSGYSADKFSNITGRLMYRAERQATFDREQGRKA